MSHRCQSCQLLLDRLLANLHNECMSHNCLSCECYALPCYAMLSCCVFIPKLHISVIQHILFLSKYTLCDLATFCDFMPSCWQLADLFATFPSQEVSPLHIASGAPLLKLCEALLESSPELSVSILTVVTTATCSSKCCVSGTSPVLLGWLVLGILVEMCPVWIFKTAQCHSLSIWGNFYTLNLWFDQQSWFCILKCMKIGWGTRGIHVWLMPCWQVCSDASWAA